MWIPRRIGGDLSGYGARRGATTTAIESKRAPIPGLLLDTRPLSPRILQDEFVHAHPPRVEPDEDDHDLPPIKWTG
jgi:hypothetical protein